MIAGETTPQVLLEAENIPQEMKTYRAWVVHRSKIPHDPLSGLRASSTDSRTWRSFDEAEAALEIGQGAYDGIGFVFSSGDPYTGIDLDDCRDPETGEITPWAQKIVDTFAEEGYVEASPSGT